ncbi:MAG: twin-arginine translocation signal domain-containing protein [Anaerolineae bacterium]|nr:twin-arginine translocation signal domain-containing protein [Anaerolineae bacterium]
MSSTQFPLSRRRFLKGAGAATLAAILSGCGSPAGEPLPSSSPGRADRPAPTSAAASPSPTATATASPAATATPAGMFQSPFHSPLATQPPPSATPHPTATPTPPPTPFPAGPPTKLGLFVAWHHPQTMELIATGNMALLKTLELDPAFLADVRARSPRTIIVGRVELDQVDLGRADPAAEARRAVEAVLPLALDERRAGLVDAWEGFNEPVAGDEGQMGKLAGLEAERVRLLAERGLRAAVGNLGAGHPPLEWWPAFRPALEAAHAHGGYLALHEYSAPTIWFNTNRQDLDFRADPADEGWLTLRYRKAYRQFLIPWGLRLPLLITECGIDGTVTGRPGPPGNGWADFGRYWAELGMGEDAPGNYIEQLAWYDAELRLDDYVHGAAIFAMTAFDGWGSYQLLGEPAAILHQYLSVHPVR